MNWQDSGSRGQLCSSLYIYIYIYIAEICRLVCSSMLQKRTSLPFVFYTIYIISDMIYVLLELQDGPRPEFKFIVRDLKYFIGTLTGTTWIVPLIRIFFIIIIY
ncbi:hypothetical protein OIU76_008466 [Salix suchowensis]|nr:hypothetical protein OIU76_008466 [Salix suchowensis]